MSQIIITGDDFGVSHAVNEAVEAQYLAGRLTQASLMIHGAQVEEAQRIAQRNPGLCVGLHLTLCAGSRKGRTPLTDVQGNFEPNPAVAGVRYFVKRSLRSAIREEIEEQFGRFLEADFPAVYWDGHTHLHLHPVVLAESLPVAARHGFRAMRLLQTKQNGGLGWIFNQLSRSAIVRLNAQAIFYTSETFGLAETGRIDDATLARFVERSRSHQLVEIYYHPGVDGPKTDEWKTGLSLTNWATWLAAGQRD